MGRRFQVAATGTLIVAVVALVAGRLLRLERTDFLVQAISSLLPALALVVVARKTLYLVVAAVVGILFLPAALFFPLGLVTAVVMVVAAAFDPPARPRWAWPRAIAITELAAFGIVVGGAYLVLPERGPVVTVCYSQHPAEGYAAYVDPDPVHGYQYGYRRVLPGVSDFLNSGDELRLLIVMEPFAPRSQVDRLVAHAQASEAVRSARPGIHPC